MTTYRVKWEIDVIADSPEGAAKAALIIQQTYNTATVFNVVNPDTNEELEIDLIKDSENFYVLKNLSKYVSEDNVQDAYQKLLDQADIDDEVYAENVVNIWEMIHPCLTVNELLNLIHE